MHHKLYASNISTPLQLVKLDCFVFPTHNFFNGSPCHHSLLHFCLVGLFFRLRCFLLIRRQLYSQKCSGEVMQQFYLHCTRKDFFVTPACIHNSKSSEHPWLIDWLIDWLIEYSSKLQNAPSCHKWENILTSTVAKWITHKVYWLPQITPKCPCVPRGLWVAPKSRWLWHYEYL